MNGIILYQSKYGATKKYATWLSQKTGFDMIETKKAKIEDIQKYDTVILGGGIYASGIAGISFIIKNTEALLNKTVIVFCVGASPYDENDFLDIVHHNMKDKISDIPCFYCRGSWNMDAMTIVDKSLCKMLQKAVLKKKPEELKNWEKALAEAKNGNCDWTDEKYLKPIFDMLKQ